MTTTTRTPLNAGVLLLCAVAASAPAAATPTYCSAGGGGGISTGDVSFGGSAADDCFGVQRGNDLGAKGAFLGWNDYEKLLSDDSGGATGASGTWMGLTWQLTGATAARSGSFTLSWSDPVALALPLALDLVIVAKASDRFGAWLFENQRFTGSAGSATGTWQINYLNNGGKPPGLSHLSVWARALPLAAVPEPATWALVALGIAGLGALLNLGSAGARARGSCAAPRKARRRRAARDR